MSDDFGSFTNCNKHAQSPLRGFLCAPSLDIFGLLRTPSCLVKDVRQIHTAIRASAMSDDFGSLFITVYHPENEKATKNRMSVRFLLTNICSCCSIHVSNRCSFRDVSGFYEYKPAFHGLEVCYESDDRCSGFRVQMLCRESTCQLLRNGCPEI